MIARADFVRAVVACIGTPVRHMGRTPGKGLDCGGLAWAAARSCGLDLPETRQYASWPSGDELTGILSDFCDRVAGDDPEAHLLQVYVGRQPRHVVVPVERCGGRVLVVHAYGRRAVVQCTPLMSGIAAGWRVRGVA